MNDPHDVDASITVLNDLSRRAIETAAQVTSNIHFNNFQHECYEYYWLHRPTRAAHVGPDVLIIARLAPPPNGWPATRQHTDPTSENIPAQRVHQRNDLYRAALTLACHVSQTWHIDTADFDHYRYRYSWMHVVSINPLPLDRSDPAHALLITRFPASSGPRRWRRFRALFSQSVPPRRPGYVTPRRARHRATHVRPPKASIERVPSLNTHPTDLSFISGRARAAKTNQPLNTSQCAIRRTCEEGTKCPNPETTNTNCRRGSEARCASCATALASRST
jgi:hypothetical protein